LLRRLCQPKTATLRMAWHVTPAAGCDPTFRYDYITLLERSWVSLMQRYWGTVSISQNSYLPESSPMLHHAYSFARHRHADKLGDQSHAYVYASPPTQWLPEALWLSRDAPHILSSDGSIDVRDGTAAVRDLRPLGQIVFTEVQPHVVSLCNVATVQLRILPTISNTAWSILYRLGGSNTAYSRLVAAQSSLCMSSPRIFLPANSQRLGEAPITNRPFASANNI
jgi:hypothetical protein